MTPRSWGHGDVKRGTEGADDMDDRGAESIDTDDLPVRDRPYESFGQQGLALATYGEQPDAHRGAERFDLGEAVAGPVSKPSGPKGWQRHDDRIREEVCQHLTYDGFVDASDIEVLVHQGEVTLMGTVNDRDQRERALRIAEMTRGVVDVVGRLRLVQR